MFAVPGWSVPSTALKTQTLVPSKPAIQATNNGTGNDGDEAPLKSKKRKRPSGKSKEKDVNPANFAEMWETVIEGKDKPKNEKKKRKVLKEVEPDEVEAVHEGDGGIVAETKGQEAAKNKESRGKKPKVGKDTKDAELGTPDVPETNGGTSPEITPPEKNPAAKRMIRHALGIPTPRPKGTEESEEEFGGFSDTEDMKPTEEERKKGKKEKKSDPAPQDEPIADAKPEVTSKPQEKERKKEGKTKKEKKREKKAKLLQGPDASTTPGPEPPAFTPAPPKPAPKLTPLQASMRQKLISARFRHLNQTLYTTPSAHSLTLFAENPEMFSEYHEGFRRQVEVWPENPVDGYRAQIQSRGEVRGPHRGGRNTTIDELKPLPRTEGKCTIADLGCGDAALSTALQPLLKKLHLAIHSFDLQSPSPLVTKADIANLPLKDGSVDIAIFCLALMGTNWIDFIEEAWRVLRWKGELWVAEIKSRFGRVGKGSKKVVDHSVGNRKRDLGKEGKKIQKKQEEALDDAVAAVEVDGVESTAQVTDVSAFVEVLRKRGFVVQGEVDLSNKMFVRMCFLKGATPMKGTNVPVPKGGEQFGQGETWKAKPKGKFVGEEEKHISSEAGVLKPCVYKLR